MAPQKQNLLLLGATGNIGTHILSAILATKHQFGRIAILTSPSTVDSKAALIQSLKGQGVEVLIGDVTKEEDILKAYEGINTIISSAGRPVIAQQIPWIKLADSHASVTRFFPSEYGTDIEYSPSSATEPPHQQKLKVRAALKECKNLEHTYVVTGPYADWFLNPMKGKLEKTGSFDVVGRRATVLGDGRGRVSLTSMRDVGILTVKALLHPQESRNRALRVNSFTTTPLEIVSEFEKQMGEKWTVEYTPFEELRQLEKEAWKGGDPTATSYTLRRIWGEGGTLYEERDNGVIDAEEMDSLEVVVREAIEKQKKESA